MPDLDDLAQFATERRLNLTGPLSHDQVVALADAWFPEVRFHERERFHPVDLPDLLSIPPRIFADMSAQEKEESVSRFSPAHAHSPASRQFQFSSASTPRSSAP